MATIIEGLYYSDSHEWIKVEGEYGYIGITDHAQQSMGSLTYVEMPEVDDEIERGEDFGAVESVKAASDLIAPVTGTVVEVNSELEESPELINKTPYDSWIIKVKISDAAELDELMNAEAYTAFCEENQ